MPAPDQTIISRDDLVLVAIDIQTRLAAVMERRSEVIAVTGRLARLASLVEAPIIVTRQYPKGLGGTDESLEEVFVGLAEAGARIIGVDKTAFCCNVETEFREALASTGRKQVVLVGMETHICVAQTALSLAGNGHQVQVVADACCSRRSADHDTTLDRLRSAGVIVTSSESVMYEAVGRAGTDEFKELLGIVKNEQP
ncbi:MAG: isochorismatase family protein [Actinomycetota bacterium]|nr:isochorismatase family protein [Actinomycetota bacterium]